jgi:thiol-disulfide isomerase/thioredoxin
MSTARWLKTLWRKVCSAAGLCAAIVAVSACVRAEDVTEKFLSEGVTARVGGYRPQRAAMDQEASIVSKAPEDLKAPKFGYIVLGDRKFAFIADEPEGAEGRLFIDSNADGDLTNDPAVEWKSEERGGLKQYSGRGKVQLTAERTGALGLYRFDPKDPRRAQLATTLMFYTDFGSEYSFQLDGKPFSTFVSGSLADGATLPIDRDGNGRVSRRFETAQIGAPFNFTGTTYKFALSEGRLTLAAAAEPIEQQPLPPNLTVGQKALSFSAKTMKGEEIQFPGAYKGKVVMLDFWATWCGPCIGEIPHMKEAYKAWHDKGFEILGVSFDQENMSEKVTSFLDAQEITWSQIYEGKGWETTLGGMHDVSAIPFVLLVDGDTGEILADAAALRGPGLSDFIGKILDARKAGEKTE